MPDPVLPDEITPRDLAAPARNELKTLSVENAERVARHMAMAAETIDDDPALAHEHALAAVRHAGRVAVARETLAVTAYATGDFALALRELRTVRRITGRNEHIAMIVDSERGVGRPEKALEEGRAVDRTELPVVQRVELAIAMSGARLDLGQTELALHELDIPEDDPDRAYEWSAGLFAARAAVLEDLGRADEAAMWSRRARIADEALASTLAESDTVVIEEIEFPVDERDDEVGEGPSDAPEGDERGVTATPKGSAQRDEVEETAQADADESASVEEQVEPAGAIDSDDQAPADPVETIEQAESADPEPAEATDAADGDAEVSIEDEVAELLAEAGIVDDDSADASAGDAAPQADSVPAHGDAPRHDAASDDGSPADEQPADDGRDEEDDRPDGALF